MRQLLIFKISILITIRGARRLTDVGCVGGWGAKGPLPDFGHYREATPPLPWQGNVGLHYLAGHTIFVGRQPNPLSLLGRNPASCNISLRHIIGLHYRQDVD